MKEGRFKLEPLNRYPHMGREDAEVWVRAIGRLAPTALGVDYDVRVGPGLPVDPGAAENMKRDWLLLTQLRIDAVVYFPQEVWIIEVKPRLLPSALGQIMAYGYWWERESDQTKAHKLVVVCERDDAQLSPVFGQSGIKVMIV